MLAVAGVSCWIKGFTAVNVRFPLPLGSGFWGVLQKTSLAGELKWRCNFPFIDSFFSHGSEKLCYGHGFFHIHCLAMALFEFVALV